MPKKNIKFKVITVIGVVLLLAAIIALLLSGDNYKILASVFTGKVSGGEIQETLSKLGMRGYITVAALSFLQIICTFIPSQPTQLLAGLAFGFPIGLAACMVGMALGNTAIFLIYRIFGDKIRGYIAKKTELDLESAAGSSKAALIILLLFFVPVIPYGIICFLAASLGMKFPRYILLTTLGALPSVALGVGLGDIAVGNAWVVSLVVFALIIVLLVVAIIKRNAIFKKINEYAKRPPYSSKTTVRNYSSVKLSVAYVISRIVFFFRGVRVRYTNKLGKNVEGPSIVLCNHGSFIDFAYAGSLIRKKRPNFIVARLYFYKKSLGNLLRSFGCFPKSMFAADLESAKNCLKVIRGGGVLAMMPEARLSTAGRFEDIQPGTYDFIKRAGVPVYTIKISGDYLASPKWGNGLRRGALVEAELDILFTKEELEIASVDEIKERTEKRLYYNEFDWLKTKPRVKYKSRKLAEGLENILSICPKCKSKYTIKTKRHDVFCEKCGKLAALDNRYLFNTGAPFSDFGEWFEWQKEEIRREIAETPDFKLESKVKFSLPSSDGKRSLRDAGEGVCRLDRSGLTYTGSRDGEDVTLFFPIKDVYRLLFGAGENFEIYVGSVIHYFAPEEKRSCVDWYIASAILSDEARSQQNS